MISCLGYDVTLAPHFHTYLKLASDPAYAPNSSGGRYFEDAVPIVPDSLQAIDAELGRDFWEASARVVSLQKQDNDPNN